VTIGKAVGFCIKTDCNSLVAYGTGSVVVVICIYGKLNKAFLKYICMATVGNFLGVGTKRLLTSAVETQLFVHKQQEILKCGRDVV